jgi:hypothetical protein
VRRSGFPECSRFISELELELEEEEGLVWSSTAITLVAFRDASFSATRRSTQLSGFFFVLKEAGCPPDLEVGLHVHII